MAHPFFDQRQQKDIMIRDYPSKLPGFYKDVQMMQGVFTCSMKAVKKLLPSKRYRPLMVMPGRAVLGINCFEYRGTNVDDYNEVSIGVAIQVDRKFMPRSFSMAAATLRQKYQGYVVSLPVNTEVALWGGVDFYDYPKFLCDIDFTEDEKTRTCTLKDSDTGDLIYSFTGKKIRTKSRPQDVPAKKLDTAHYYSYPIKDEKEMLATIYVNQIEKGSRWFRGGMTMNLGEHKHTRPLADLKPGRLLQYVYMPRAESILEEPSFI